VIGREIKAEIKKGVKELADHLIKEAFQEIKKGVLKEEIERMWTS
jgi:hypothetical protein